MAFIKSLEYIDVDALLMVRVTHLHSSNKLVVVDKITVLPNYIPSDEHRYDAEKR